MSRPPLAGVRRAVQCVRIGIVAQLQIADDGRMDNPIVSALAPIVTSNPHHKLSLDTYGPAYLPHGVVVLVTLDDRSESEINRCPISAVTKAQFSRWFSDAVTWLDRQPTWN